MNNKILKTALLGLTVISLATVSTTAFSAKKKVKMEKCTGIVKAGKADGKQMFNGKETDWILVPAGACEKLVDGVVIYENK
jgi:uncharacterized membrane protein